MTARYAIPERRIRTGIRITNEALQKNSPHLLSLLFTYSHLVSLICSDEVGRSGLSGGTLPMSPLVLRNPLNPNKHRILRGTGGGWREVVVISAAELIC